MICLYLTTFFKARLLKKARTFVQVFFCLPTATKATAIEATTAPRVTAP